MILIVAFAEIRDAKGSEKAYQVAMCNSLNGGLIEYVLEDYTRVDCLIGDYAIEFDYAKKWSEAIGQSLLYGSRTNLRPGIVLIMESKKDCKYLDRLDEAISFGGIGVKVWQTGDYAYRCTPW